MDILKEAENIAREAHSGVFRKWGSKEPYITHPERCSLKAKALGYGERVQAIMWLHDVIEDSENPVYWENVIKTACGGVVLKYCLHLTNVTDRLENRTQYKNARRAEKWSVNLAHISNLPKVAKVCKMIDRLDNISGTVYAPQKWKSKYYTETLDLLNVCEESNPGLAAELRTALYKFNS